MIAIAFRKQILDKQLIKQVLASIIVSDI